MVPQTIQNYFKGTGFIQRSNYKCSYAVGGGGVSGPGPRSVFLFFCSEAPCCLQREAANMQKNRSNLHG